MKTLLWGAIALWAVLLVGCASAPSAAAPTPVGATAGEARTPTEICDAAVPAATPSNRQFTAADEVLQPGVDYRAVFCTEAGPVYIDLYEDGTPITVNNFVFLAENGYYNNTTFHRVLANFMAQGGDPTATGSGDPGYAFQDEFVSTLSFDAPGKLAMANSGPNTNGSQFFITTVPTPHLNQLHTIFGEVLEGQENVENIRLRDPGTNPNAAPGAALQTVVIVVNPEAVTLTPKPEVTQEEVVAAFEGVSDTITGDLTSLLQNEISSFTTDEAVAASPEAARETLSGWLEAHQHSYRVSDTVTNIACSLDQIQFMSASYTLDAFPTREISSAALADEALIQSLESSGFSQQPSESLAYPLFTQNVTQCDQPAVWGLTYWQRGRFISTVEIVLPSDNEGAAVLDRVLSEFIGFQLFEPLLSDVLYRDIR